MEWLFRVCRDFCMVKSPWKSSPRAAFNAGRLMLEEIVAHVKRGENLAFETTLSGLTYAQMIPA